MADRIEVEIVFPPLFQGWTVAPADDPVWTDIRGELLDRAGKEITDLRVISSSIECGS